MLYANEIKTCLKTLNDELRAMEVKGEICLYGGAVMALVYQARPSTKDVDAIFRQEVFDILEKYYPRQQIKPATQFFIEELFEQ